MMSDQREWITELVIGIYLIVSIPILVWFRVRTLFRSDSRLTENINCSFSQDRLMLKGESFEAAYDWFKIVRVAETKDFFLIYHSKSGAQVLPKRFMTAEQVVDQRGVLVSIKGLKTRLIG